MRDFLAEMTGLCLMRMLLDMVLPEGDAQRCAALGMGLITMLCLLKRTLAFFRGMA